MTRKSRRTLLDEFTHLTIKEVCQVLHISEATYHALNKRGHGPKTIRIGRMVRIRLRDLKRWLRKARLGAYENRDE